MESTKSCGQFLDSVITVWQSPSLTWLPPWPLPNVINIPNQRRKQGGSGRGCEHDLLVGFKQQVTLCLHLRVTRTSVGVITANDANGSSASNSAMRSNSSFQKHWIEDSEDWRDGKFIFHEGIYKCQVLGGLANFSKVILKLGKNVTLMISA